MTDKDKPTPLQFGVPFGTITGLPTLEDVLAAAGPELAPYVLAQHIEDLVEAGLDEDGEPVTQVT
jgi:hypothetical protein